MHLLKTPNTFDFFYKPACLVFLKVAQQAEGISLIRGKAIALWLIEPVEHHICQKQSLKTARFSRMQSSLQGLLVFGNCGVECSQATFSFAFFT